MKFLLFLAFALLVSATHVNFQNKCGYDVNVVRTENNRAPTQQAYLRPGQWSGADFYGNGMNFKKDWNGQTLAEFSFNNGDGNDYYDLSVIVGFDVPMQIQSDRAPWVTCTYKQCPDAYQYPTDESKTHGVRTGGTFTVVFCP